MFKILDWFNRIRYRLSQESCYDEQEKLGNAVFHCCGGMTGGDKTTEWLQYSCVDCPYLVLEKHKPAKTEMIDVDDENGNFLFKTRIDICDDNTISVLDVIFNEKHYRAIYFGGSKFAVAISDDLAERLITVLSNSMAAEEIK